jgi:hypothetical protein
VPELIELSPQSREPNGMIMHQENHMSENWRESVKCEIAPSLEELHDNLHFIEDRLNGLETKLIRMEAHFESRFDELMKSLDLFRAK